MLILAGFGFLVLVLLVIVCAWRAEVLPSAAHQR